jgi:hypothetical protein
MNNSNDRKRFISSVLTGLAAISTLCALTLVPVDADAQSRGAGARGSASGVRGHVSGVRGHSVHSGARVGVYLGAPFIASPWWYSPYPYSNPYYYGYGPYYYPPPVYMQEQPSVYVERQAPPPAPAASAPQAQPEQYWYYCQDSKTYFPYVQKCATPWQRVIPYATQ